MLSAEPGGAGGSGVGAAGSAAAAVASASAAAAAAVADHVTCTLEERVSVRMTRDGACESMEVKGALTLTAQDEARAAFKVALERGEGAAAFQFQTHPHLNKAAFTAGGVIEAKVAGKPFPVGMPLAVLKWNRKVKDGDGSVVPLALTCWPEAGAGGTMNVNLEYTLQDDTLALADVVVTVPLGGDTVPKVGACSGEWKHNTREHVLTWHIDTIDAATPTGALEFSVKGRSEDAFFPVTVTFTSSDLLCPLAVASVTPVGDDKPLRYSASRSLATESYTVE